MTSNTINYCIVYLCCLFFITYVIYISLSITFLVNNKEISENCDNSNLWFYNLISLVIPITIRCIIIKSNGIKQGEGDNCEEITSVICCSLIETGLIIWGFIELFNNDLSSNDCQKIKHNNMWYLGIINISLQFISIIFIVIYFIKLFLNKIYEKNTNLTSNLIPP